MILPSPWDREVAGEDCPNGCGGQPLGTKETTAEDVMVGVIGLDGGEAEMV